MLLSVTISMASNSAMVANSLTNDMRYKEGMKCINKGMYDEAIELLGSLSEEW